MTTLVLYKQIVARTHAERMKFIDSMFAEKELSEAMEACSVPFTYHGAHDAVVPVRNLVVLRKYASAISRLILNYGTMYRTSKNNVTFSIEGFGSNDKEYEGFFQLDMATFKCITRHICWQVGDAERGALGLIAFVCAHTELRYSLEWESGSLGSAGYYKPLRTNYVDADEYIRKLFDLVFIAPVVGDYTSDYGIVITDVWIRHHKAVLSGDHESPANMFFNRYIVPVKTSSDDTKDVLSRNVAIDILERRCNDEDCYESYRHVPIVRYEELHAIAGFGDIPGGLDMFFTYAFHKADELFRLSTIKPLEMCDRLPTLIEAYRTFLAEEQVQAFVTESAIDSIVAFRPDLDFMPTEPVKVITPPRKSVVTTVNEAPKICSFTPNLTEIEPPLSPHAMPINTYAHNRHELFPPVPLTHVAADVDVGYNPLSSTERVQIDLNGVAPAQLNRLMTFIVHTFENTTVTYTIAKK